MHALIPRTTISEVVAARDAALAAAREAASVLHRGRALAEQAAGYATQANAGRRFHLVDHAANDAYGRLFARIDPAASVEAFRRHLDASTWLHLLDLARISDLMDRTAVEQLQADLAGNVPEVTEDAVVAILDDMMRDAKLIFARGIARVFGELDRRFKSHDGFKIGSRVVLTRMFDDWGHWNSHRNARETLTDVERAFAVLDGQRDLDVGALVRAVDEARGGRWGQRQSTCETRYFRVRTFKNGNAHLWMLRDDLVERVNLVLADFYGAVLPDAVPPEVSPDDLRSSTGALSRDLAFFPTPPAVVGEMLRNLDLGPASTVLEPSAGEGGITRVVLDRGARVDAVEVDPGRCAVLQQLAVATPRLAVTRANFLTLPARPAYSHVLMNPPFSGTHWMQHVMHAYDFLAPGGTLVAVLPVSAEIGESRAHETFRAWAAQRGRWRSDRIDFRDLPAESFAASGTRINTVLLTLHRAR